MYKINFVYNRKAGHHFYLSKVRREAGGEGRETKRVWWAIIKVHDVLEWKFLYERHHYL